MGRSPCCIKDGVNKGAWTAEEDKILVDYVKDHGEGKWRRIPKGAGLKRCGKSCRLRWLNYLRPDIIRGNITSDEEDLIIRLHRLLGNRWSLIAGRLPGRTDNEIKNYWNTNLSKRVHGKKSKPDPKPGSSSQDQLAAVHAGGSATPLHSPSPSAAASESSGSFFSGCSFLLCDQTGSDPFDSGLSEHYPGSAGRTSPEFGSDQFDACVGPVVLSPEDAEEMNNNKWMDCEWGHLDVFLEAEDWINYP